MGRVDTRRRLQLKLEKRRRKALEPDVLVDQASNAIDEYDYEKAQDLLERALGLDADHVKALELTASLLLEAGETEKAKHCLGRAVTVEPHQGHEKYFSLAQLFSGTEALGLYKEGIAILSRTDKGAVKSISNAYVSIAELFTTDLCDEDNAESECIKHIESAIEADPANPEAFQMKALYFLIKENFDEARTALTESLNLWLPSVERVLENKQDVGTVDPVEVCSLSYESRLSAIKLCLELEDFDSSTRICESMLEEDDTVVDTWYLLGWTNKLRSKEEDEYRGNARYYLTKAKVTHKKHPTSDTDMLEHIDEILEELGPDLEEGEKDPQNRENADNLENYETSDEEDEDKMET